MRQNAISILMVILVVSLFSVNTIVAADNYKIRFGTGNDDKTAQYKSMVVFKKLVEDNSAGRVTIELYPGGQIGSDVEMMEALRMGTQEMCWPSTAPVSNFAKEFQILDLPYAFPSVEAAHYVLNSGFGQKLLNTLSPAGLVGLSWGEFGIRHLTNKIRPVKSVEDMKGLKIRVMQNPVHIATFKALGANPAPLTFGELFSALQQGVFDGMECPWDLILDMKFYEVQRYGTDIGWLYSPGVLLISKKFWDKLPADLQVVIKKAALAAQEHNWKTIHDNIAEKTASLEKVLKITNLTSEQRAQFIKATMPIHNQFKQSNPALYDEFQNVLKQYKPKQ